LSPKEEPSRSAPQKLESKNYSFFVDGTMPVLEFDIASGQQQEKKTHLRVELYNPLSGEVFEAKFPKGRIEVDNDGSLTYFSTSEEKVNISLFLGYNLQLIFYKDGRFTLRSPSRIVPLRKYSDRATLKKRVENHEVRSDVMHFRLE